MVFSRRKYTNRQNKSRKMYGGVKYPEKFCSKAGVMPPEPKESLIHDTAPFAKPWLDINSNVLFIALAVNPDSPLGLMLSKIATDVEQVAFKPYTGGPFRNPHISLMNVYIPENTAKATLHTLFNNPAIFDKVATMIFKLIAKYIINSENLLVSNYDKYKHFGKFIVKTYDDNSIGNFTYFINSSFKPFREEFILLLGKLLDPTNKAFHTDICYPAYFPEYKSVPKFKHYRVLRDTTTDNSDFAINTYFDTEYKPHISIVNDSNVDVDTYIPSIKQWDAINSFDLLFLNNVILNSENFSSVFISYNGNFKVLSTEL